MKKIFAALFITLLGLSFAFSQETAKPVADWKTFAPAAEEFSVETPVALNASIVKLPETDNITGRRYLNSIDGTYFFIFSDNPKNARNSETVQKFVKNYAQSGMSESFGDFEGEKYVFKDSQNFYHEVLIVKSKKRIYAFQTISRTKENAAVERFFRSLKFEGKPGTAKTIEPSISRELNLPMSNSQDRKFPVGGGSGSGRGTGGGQNNDLVLKSPIQTVTVPDGKPTPVRILSKPRANYTDFARFYEISGRVVLRVTFSSDGTIGTIVIISGLPLGLTEQAIAAAKGIKFEPATKGGVPYSVTKPVEYSFIIY